MPTASESSRLVSTVLAEFQLPFDLDSKDADLKDIEGSLHPGGRSVLRLIEDAQGKVARHFTAFFPLNHNTCELRKDVFSTGNPRPSV